MVVFGRRHFVLTLYGVVIQVRPFELARARQLQVQIRADANLEDTVANLIVEHVPAAITRIGNEMRVIARDSDALLINGGQKSDDVAAELLAARVSGEYLDWFALGDVDESTVRFRLLRHGACSNKLKLGANSITDCP